MISVSDEKIGSVWYAVATNNRGSIVVCNFSTEGREDVLNKLMEILPPNEPWQESLGDEVAKRALNALSDIYDGREVKYPISLALDNLPTFSLLVIKTTMHIPPGYVTTYGRIAARLGKKGAARAVGNAEASNPFPLLVPCHRVVRSDLEVGKYGCGGGEMKRQLLRREGVKFVGEKVSKESLWPWTG